MLTAGFMLTLAVLGEPETPRDDQVRHQRASRSAPAPSLTFEQRLADAHAQQIFEQARADHDRDFPQFAKGKHMDPEMRAKQIALLIEMIDEYGPDDPELPDTLFRLASHYIDAKEYSEVQAAALEFRILETENQ